MKRRHEMPFGAECREDGSVRFRLWAPAALQVELSIANTSAPQRLSLQKVEQGWYELITDAAKAGTQYRFRIDGAQEVPDPASRFQPQDVHGPSQVVDSGFEWEDGDWRGRNWDEAVIYELHVGTFSPSGTFDGVRQRLDYLRDLGVTAIELMPLGDFPGRRNWGYDGVLLFAPDSSYGSPDDLKRLVQAAHQRGMMVLLDVVYNHFGPEGNYLNAYAPQFFTDRHHTPWGKAINFDGPESRVVRDFFIHNALYWLNEYHFDGLRLDAVHAIIDDSTPHILTELAAVVRNNVGPERQVHLVLENDLNQTRYLQPTNRCEAKTYNAQWNDDIHHALHVLLTREHDGYYSDYSSAPLDQLGRCLSSGFAYQGEVSLFREGARRGESTAGTPLTAFVNFLQNHDQVGNRAFGERINTLAPAEAVRAASAILLLASSPPLLFMGEEFGTKTPFLFFCDFEDGLAQAVAAGRRNEFARFERFSDPEIRAGIPDPNDARTFESSRLDWQELDQPEHGAWLDFHRELLRMRCRHIAPLLSNVCKAQGEYEILKGQVLRVKWIFPDEALVLVTNLASHSVPHADVPEGQLIYATHNLKRSDLKSGTLPPWCVLWLLQSAISA